MPVTISGNGTVTGAQVGYNAVATITATDASWTVPTLADPYVKVTVVGGGGGGGGAASSATDGATGGTSTFACSAGTATATGGSGGEQVDGNTRTAKVGTTGLSAGNGGQPGAAFSGSYEYTGRTGNGGSITVAYLDLTGVSTASVTVGAGGAGGTSANTGGGGAVGGNGVVIVEYRAG